MKEEDRLYSFCNRQSTFILLLCKLHLVKATEAYCIPHPLTGNTEAYIQKCYIWKPLRKLIPYLVLNLVDDEGLERMDRLKACGVLTYTTNA